MIDARKIGQLIAETGPGDDAILAVVQTGDDSWVIRYEHVDVDLELDAETARLVLSAEIGVPPAERRLSIYELLLAYSLLWRETGGIRMALTGAGGAAVQLVDLAAADLTVGVLATVAANLADRTLVWRAFFTGGAPAETKIDSLAEMGIRI